MVLAPLTGTPRDVPSAVWVKASRENCLQTDSRIEISQIRTVDKGRIQKVIGHLKPNYYSSINEKISDFLDLRDEYL